MYKFLFRNLILPTLNLAHGGKLLETIRTYENYDQLSENELQSIQKAKLKKLLKHASKHCKKYSGISSNVDDAFEWLNEFPIVDKSALRNKDLLITCNERRLRKHVSSGSSGKQSTVYMDFKEETIPIGIQTHWWNWAGYEFGDRILQTGMSTSRRGLKKLKDILFRTNYYYAFSHDETEITKMLSDLDPRKKFFLGGYASSLYLIAQTAKDLSIDIKFSGIASWGDKLFSHYRTILEDTFQTKVYDSYGIAEGIMIAAQKDLDFYYIMTPHVVVEILDDSNQKVPDGEMGNVVVTQLDNYSMPLIRYKVGDLGVILPREKYPKKRKMNYPLLERIIGRDTDIVRSRSGKFLTVHSFTGIFEHIPEIKQFQVIQKNLEGIHIKYIPRSPSINGVLQKLRNKIQNGIGSDLVVDFIEVDTIDPSPSGKPQIVISEI